MSVEVAFAIAKFVAVIITGISAVIGLQVNFKDKEDDLPYGVVVRCTSRQLPRW